MTRIPRTILALALAAAPSFAESSPLEGEPFRPAAPVFWAAPTNDLPTTLMVYKVVPQQFSKEVMSNILAITSFKPRALKLSPDKKTMHWEDNRGGAMRRRLTISPALGWIDYLDTKAVEISTNAAKGVPSFEEVERLALEYCRRLGGDTNQLAMHPTSRTYNHRTLFNKKGGDMILEDVTARGIMVTRQVDGIRFAGSSGRGGLYIEFANQSKLHALTMNWRNLQPHQRHKTANPNAIVAWVAAGKAVEPNPAEDASQARKLTITKITPYYLGEVGGAPQDLVLPFAQLEVVADLEGTNKATLVLHCPIIDAKPN